MARPRKDAETPAPKRPPATTAEGRERHLVGLAADLAEKQLRNGTASSQVISHFLKLATVRETLERDKLAAENRLLQARVEAMASDGNLEALYSNAIAAMKTYQTGEEYEEYDDNQR